MSGATDRLPRLLALVPYLLARPGVRVGAVADVFGVTEKQLRADLDLLFVCGLPGHGPGDLIDMTYEGDRVTLTNSAGVARPLRLSADEALALVVALRALAGVPGLEERDALDRALVKLEAAAGAAAGPTANVQVSLEAEAGVLPTVRDALERRRLLHLRYHVAARDESTERDVDPMRLLMVEGRTYLEAWCRRVEDVRLFRLDRVLSAEVLDAPAEPPPSARPRDLSEGLFAPSSTDAAVTLALSPAARWVADYYPCESVEESTDGGLHATLRTPDTRWLRALALRLGSDGAVLDPPELAEEVRAEARSALAAYGKAD
ncbi:MAG: WYL domain-containing protein [Actinomycetota bacterium]|nr:WYL domain-containing protein [Actinomycetota bacterium]